MDYKKLIILKLGINDENNVWRKYELCNKEYVDTASMLFIY